MLMLMAREVWLSSWFIIIVQRSVNERLHKSNVGNSARQSGLVRHLDVCDSCLAPRGQQLYWK